MNEESYVWGTGKRKCAIAQARLFPGKGEIMVNDRPYQEAFPRIQHRRMIEHPLQATNTMGKFSITVKVNGGGLSGQAGAVRHGISRALLEYNAELRERLKSAGLLTRDPRKKERKKYGQKGARARYQFSKR